MGSKISIANCTSSSAWVWAGDLPLGLEQLQVGTAAAAKGEALGNICRM